jgi:hypothetical protein
LFRVDPPRNEFDDHFGHDDRFMSCNLGLSRMITATTTSITSIMYDYYVMHLKAYDNDLASSGIKIKYSGKRSIPRYFEKTEQVAIALLYQCYHKVLIFLNSCELNESDDDNMIR